jgi:hypothetical protein
MITAAAILTAAALRKPRLGRVILFNALLLYAGILGIQAVLVGVSTVDGKLEEALRLRQSGLPDAYPSVSAQAFIDITPAFPDFSPLPLPSVAGEPVHPLSGLANVPSVFCKEDDGWMVYDADDQGYTNPPGIHPPFDAVIVGDSFVQGACVGTEYSFVETLRKEGLHVYNLGMGGAGPLTDLAQIVENLDRLSPRLVVWVHFAGNDIKHPKREFSDLDFEMRTETLRAYLADPEHSQDLCDRKGLVDRALRRILDSRIEDRSRYAEARRWVSFLMLQPICDTLGIDIHPPRGRSGFEPPDDATRLDIFERVIRRAKATSERGGATLVFVYLPWKIEDSLKQDVLGIVERNGIDTLDLSDVVSTGDDVWAKNGGHFSRSGNAAVGERLARFLLRQSRRDAPQAR